MPLQNRVTPTGALVADPGRGLVFGNRGCLHDAAGRIRRRYQGRRWIACRLEFGGRRRQPLLQPGRYTELFFLDEVTAFAAGHRPCAECRREDFDRFTAMWRDRVGGDAGGVAAIDSRLHAERLDDGGTAQRPHHARAGDLPEGAFVLRDGSPWLLLGGRLLRWTAGGYVDAVPHAADDEPAVVLTPPSLVAMLRAGWRPATVEWLHPSAQRIVRG